MVRRYRPRLTQAQRAELWRRWRQGETLQAIGRALDRATPCVRYFVAETGGVPPSPRQRSRLALTGAEREEVSRGLAHGRSLRAIGRGLGRAASTVSREVRRHGGRQRYRAADADRRAWRWSRRPKRCRLATYPALRDAVAAQLACEWSPQQIAGWLRQAYPDDPTMHVSYETIYLSLFVQSRGVLKKALLAHLRQRRTYRRPQTRGAHPGGHIVDAVSIRERPAAVEDRAVPGHWEGDLLVGARKSYIATLVERRSRYVCLVRVSGKATRTVVRALTRHVQRLPAGVRSGGRCNMTREGGHHGASVPAAAHSGTESRTLATVAPGRDAAGDWPGARSGHTVRALFCGGDRRRAPVTAAAVALGADGGRA